MEKALDNLEKVLIDRLGELPPEFTHIAKLIRKQPIPEKKVTKKKQTQPEKKVTKKKQTQPEKKQSTVAKLKLEDVKSKLKKKKFKTSVACYNVTTGKIHTKSAAMQKKYKFHEQDGVCLAGEPDDLEKAKLELFSQKSVSEPVVTYDGEHGIWKDQDMNMWDSKTKSVVGKVLKKSPWYRQLTETESKELKNIGYKLWHHDIKKRKIDKVPTNEELKQFVDFEEVVIEKTPETVFTKLEEVSSEEKEWPTVGTVTHQQKEKDVADEALDFIKEITVPENKDKDDFLKLFVVMKKQKIKPTEIKKLTEKTGLDKKRLEHLLKHFRKLTKEYIQEIKQMV